MNLQIFNWTAQRHLYKANVYCFRAAHKIPLTRKHRDFHVAFALHQLNTASPEDWNRTIWINEKVFCSTDDQHIQVWKSKNHQLNPKYVVPRGVKWAYHL